MNEKVFDYIILGAGPAGLQLGYFMQRAGHDYLILEAGDSPGTFFTRYPRHRQLISINKCYTGNSDPEFNLRMDWNSLLSDSTRLLFPNYSQRYFPPAGDLLRYLADFAETFSLNIQYECRIAEVAKQGGYILTSTAGATYRCRRLIVATGLSLTHLPDIPGIDLVDTYADVSVDPRDYVNQRVLVIGKGNSAFETADNLVETTAAVHVAGPAAIKFAWQTHYVGHLRAVNNNLLDTYQLKSQNAILDGNILAIEKQRDQFRVTFSFVRADEVQKQLCYDRVIACTGFRFDDSPFALGCRPTLAINNRFPAQTAGWESANVKDLFFAGTLMQERDYRKSTSGFIHGFRYCVRSLFHMLEKRYHHRQWPARELPRAAADLMEVTIGRVNRTSALWQQFGFLGDLIAFDGDRAHYYEELPVAYIHQSEWGEHDSYFIITLEYGPDHAAVDPFDIDIHRVAQNDAENALNAQYLHPVVRHFHRTELVAEHHLAENLENEWNSPAHTQPLLEFFTTHLPAERGAALV